MAVPKAILLTSASGNIGKRLVPLLLSQDPTPKLILPTSSAEKLKSAIPSITQPSSTQHVVAEEGSVKDPVWFQSLLTTHSVDTVFLCLTGTDELYTAMLCLDAVSRVSTVKRLIYLSITGDFTSEAGFASTVRTRGYPHLFAKVLVEQRLKHADFNFSWTVLGPTLFFSNDEAQKPSLLANSSLSSPLSEQGVNKVSLPDIALAVRNAMYDTTGAWDRRKIMLGSKQAYTGQQIKEIWSQALNKPVCGSFATSEGMDAFEQQVRSFAPTEAGKATVRSLRILFEFLTESGLGITAEEYEEQVKLLGKEPDDYEAWVKTTVEAWLKE